MSAKHVIIFLLMSLAVCLVGPVGATETPADANTEEAAKAPSVSPAPTAKPQTSPAEATPEPTAEADPAAPVAYIPQKVFSFPSTMDGASVVHDFIIQNKGDAPLKITKVRTG